MKDFTNLMSAASLVFVLAVTCKTTTFAVLYGVEGNISNFKGNTFEKHSYSPQ